MNRDRRVLASIALGVALAVVASALVARMSSPIEGGWFMYAPSSTTLYTTSSTGHTVRAAAVWLAAVAVWFGVSWRMFRTED